MLLEHLERDGCADQVQHLLSCASCLQGYGFSADLFLSSAPLASMQDDASEGVHSASGPSICASALRHLN